ncbi:MAG: hypothetical protein A2Y67_03410 [Candidatus Buchananbacteria bacterium RBG_13_39_9]|uniref:Elp3/MiaA/NifB-like radical SAM core domain-containing protein n=1 Tax=Candidatus Buchananbacteria bacterium RBG_13_39_9 TaxID=1797531 RepID=A0A1G1XSK6_9BACT|nr:MAG: hypothetical protein A2Y67_03410 [Candidatus Buchananbacteria bacterium RBG_13_39_9]
MRIMMALALILSLLKVDFAYSGKPNGFLWGNPAYHQHDAQNHSFTNKALQNESWWKTVVDKEYLKTHPEFNQSGTETIPEKKEIKVSLRQDYYLKPENLVQQFLAGMILLQKKVKPYFVHCTQDKEYDERFDTLMMPSGSVAALVTISDDLRHKYDFLLPALAIDESYPNADVHGREREYLLRYLHQEIENDLVQEVTSAIFCSVYSYNAEQSLKLLQTLKQEYGDRIRTGVGGPLIRVIPATYQSLPFIDHVGVGDAEVVLESLLIGERTFSEGYLQLNPETGQHYARFSYDNYLALADRLKVMSQLQYGLFTNIRHLVLESVRGCSWANAIGKPCEMCSLQSINSAPLFKPFPEYFDIENQLAEKLNINWVFDVSNQFLPVMGLNQQEKWLKEYLDARKKFSQTKINKYAYLTANSITERTAPLLREADIRIIYIGFDGWNSETRHALHKPQVDPFKVLQICRDNDLYVRTGTVIGAGATDSNVQELPDFAKRMISEYQGTILTWGLFLEEILPGSYAWSNLQKQAQQNNWQEVTRLYQFFTEHGFLRRDQQEKLTEHYLRLLQYTDFDAIVAVRDQVKEIVSPHTIAITFKDGGHLKT